MSKRSVRAKHVCDDLAAAWGYAKKSFHIPTWKKIRKGNLGRPFKLRPTSNTLMNAPSYTQLLLSPGR